MTGKQFLDLVALMRKAQREWFSTHNPRWLVEAKRLETCVDQQIEVYKAAWEKTQPKQLDFFDKLETSQ